jgi:hypothetical protein
VSGGGSTTAGRAKKVVEISTTAEKAHLFAGLKDWRKS